MEQERRHQLEQQCKPNRVRTYACDEDGFRVVKYYSYRYDFDQDQCVERVTRRSVRCERSHPRDAYVDDDEGMSPSHSASRSHRGRYADEYGDYGHQVLTQKGTHSAAEEDLTEQESQAASGDQDEETQPVEKASKASKDSSQKEIKKLAKHIG